MTRLMPYQGGLCRPMDPYTRYTAVYTRHFNANFSISLRPLCLEKDVPLLYSWIKKAYIPPPWKPDIPYNEIIQTIIHMAHSDFAQVFTGMHINEPLCEVEVMRASQDDELCMSPFVAQGDYVIRVMPGDIAQAKHLAMIQTCVEYFLQHSEVKRVLAVIDNKNVRDNTVMKKAGFALLSTIPAPYKMNNVYVYTRSGNER